MDRSEVITLLTATKTQNDYGVWVENLTARDVFCQVDSVSMTISMTMFAGDYQGERLLIYKNSTYSVYRTYQGRNDTVELYVERKGGSNGKTHSTD